MSKLGELRDEFIVFDDVSKFYGDILGVNRVSLKLAPGVTSLVGPNGSGKTTLMNLMTGLVRPTRGQVRILGIAPDAPERLFRVLGYCAQFDSFPRGMTGFEFVRAYLGLHGWTKGETERRAWAALERVGLADDAASRNVNGYSKGMRQRARLAQSIAHEPQVLILDEPLNGLDPLARAETIELFRRLAAEGLHLIISSHILHEVDMMSDRVVLINNGYVVAEGGTGEVREEITAEPLEIFVACDRPAELAADLLRRGTIAEARLLLSATEAQPAGATDADAYAGVFVRTPDAEKFYLQLNEIVADGKLRIDSIKPVDDDLGAVYGYLIGAQASGGGANV